MTTYRSSLRRSKLGKPFFINNCQIASFSNLRFFLYFTSTHGGLYIFHLYLVAFIILCLKVPSLFSCQRRLLLSAEGLHIQIVPRSVQKRSVLIWIQTV